MMATFLHNEWLAIVFILLHLTLVFSAVKIVRYLSRMVRNFEIFQAEHHLMLEYVADAQNMSMKEIRLRALAYSEARKGASAR